MRSEDTVSGCLSLLFKCKASLLVFLVGKKANGSTVGVYFPVLVLAVVGQWDQCWSWHLFSRAELSLSLALLHDLKASLFLDRKARSSEA